MIGASLLLATAAAASGTTLEEPAAFLHALAIGGSLTFDGPVDGVVGAPPHAIAAVTQNGCTTMFRIADRTVKVDWSTAALLTWTSDDGRIGFVTVDNRHFRLSTLAEAGLVAQTFGAMRTACTKDLQ